MKRIMGTEKKVIAFILSLALILGTVFITPVTSFAAPPDHDVYKNNITFIKRISQISCKRNSAATDISFDYNIKPRFIDGNYSFFK